MDDHDTTTGAASARNGTGYAPDDTAAEPGPVNHTTAFLAEIARAMHAAAGDERQRIATELSDEATAQVERTQARAAIEIEELRRLADEDIERIHAWAASEMERITAEEARRTEQRRADLENYLQEHETIIATEVDGVHAAVQDYQATLDAYFDELIESTDPADIVARAGSLPAPPDLDEVRAVARASAVARFAALAIEPSADDAGDPEEPSGSAGFVVGDETGAGETAVANDERTDDAAVAAETRWADGASDGTADETDHVDANAVEIDDANDVGAAPVGVMDPDAIGTTAELTGEPVPESNGEPSPEPVAWPSERAHATALVGDSGVGAYSAVRLLRSIAPWTAPSVDEEQPDPSIAR